MNTRYSGEQIISNLCEAEAEISAWILCCRQAISNACHNGRRKSGGMKVPKVWRLMILEKENINLKILLAETMMNKRVIQVAPVGKYR